MVASARPGLRSGLDGIHDFEGAGFHRIPKEGLRVAVLPVIESVSEQGRPVRRRDRPGGIRAFPD
jgi:hypothetical protein